MCVNHAKIYKQFFLLSFLFYLSPIFETRKVNKCFCLRVALFAGWWIPSSCENHCNRRVLWILWILPLNGLADRYCGSLGPRIGIITVRRQSYVFRLPKYWPPTPLSARRVCNPSLCCGGRTHSPGEEGGGVNILEDARHSSVLYLYRILFA